MKDEPKAEAGLYPFEECCEHPFRHHSSKACQIPGCPCKRRRQLPAATVAPPPVIEHLQDKGWRLTHEVTMGQASVVVVTRVHAPDGTILSETAWTPDPPVSP